MKKIISVVCALLVLTTTVVNAAFTDMADCSDEAQSAVNTMVEKRYINGTSETEFSPNKFISRAELAAVILRILNRMDNTLVPTFSDVSKYDWFYRVAAASQKEKIIDGYDDGTFRGNDYITKEQLIAVLVRVMESKIAITVPNMALTYSDGVPEWAQDYVRIAKDAGLYNESTDNKFYGSMNVTRANAAVMIMRMYNKIADTLDYDSFVGEDAAAEASPRIIVLDAGHGKDSWAMTDAEKTAEGWLYNSSTGNWGEWRHWKSGTVWQDCQGYGCSGRGNCWYPMGYGDRDTEPELTLSNTTYAKMYLEQMGYEVRLARPTANDNPSMTKRLTYCYPNNDTSQAPDADMFVCIHSNAGGGRGSAYIALDGTYDQAGIKSTYAHDGNLLGQYINNSIVSKTSMGRYGSGRYNGLPEAVLFCKSPITIAYLEIGFYDNADDLAILQSESEQIGKAIAEGIDEYCTDVLD